MAMPRDLFLVRHGESEGNVALAALKESGATLASIAPETLAKYSGQWCLTSKGVGDAEAAGAWLKENDFTSFDRYISSDYARAKATAGHLGMAGAEWMLEFYLRERDRGHEGQLLTKEDRERRFGEYAHMKDMHSFYWRPQNGESMADVCMRVNRVLDKLHRDCDGQRVIITCHEETIWAFRTRLERLSPEDYLAMESISEHKIGNGHIMHYTRQHPDATAMAEHFTHWRLIDPRSEIPADWNAIQRRRFSNEEMLA